VGQGAKLSSENKMILIDWEVSERRGPSASMRVLVPGPSRIPKSSATQSFIENDIVFACNLHTFFCVL
jgi:hypothetical protein